MPDLSRFITWTRPRSVPRLISRWLPEDRARAHTRSSGAYEKRSRVWPAAVARSITFSTAATSDPAWAYAEAREL
eukprot:scaffold152133_cov32-Tisochrysis_lutea.AAC.2